LISSHKSTRRGISAPDGGCVAHRRKEALLTKKRVKKKILSVAKKERSKKEIGGCPASYREKEGNKGRDFGIGGGEEGVRFKPFSGEKKELWREKKEKEEKKKNEGGKREIEPGIRREKVFLYFDQGISKRQERSNPDAKSRRWGEKEEGRRKNARGKPEKKVFFLGYNSGTFGI